MKNNDLAAWDAEWAEAEYDDHVREMERAASAAARVLGLDLNSSEDATPAYLDCDTNAHPLQAPTFENWQASLLEAWFAAFDHIDMLMRVNGICHRKRRTTEPNFDRDDEPYKTTAVNAWFRGAAGVDPERGREWLEAEVATYSRMVESERKRQSRADEKLVRAEKRLVAAAIVRRRLEEVVNAITQPCFVKVDGRFELVRRRVFADVHAALACRDQSRLAIDIELYRLDQAGFARAAVREVTGYSNSGCVSPLPAERKLLGSHPGRAGTRQRRARRRRGIRPVTGNPSVPFVNGREHRYDHCSTCGPPTRTQPQPLQGCSETQRSSGRGVTPTRSAHWSS